MPSKYDPETRAKAVRLVLEHRDDYPSEWAAITAVSKRLGMNAETLRNWIRRSEAARVPRRLHSRSRREALLRPQTNPTKGGVIQRERSPERRDGSVIVGTIV
ncbi:MAG: hypothetical protein NVS4B6_17030 [Mycobacterium sp.]